MNLLDSEIKSPGFFNDSSSAPGDAANIIERRTSVPNRRTVFVVDNDSSFRSQLERLIGSYGYRVESFASAEKFLQKEINVEAACLVLNVYLPGMDGLCLQKLLLQRGILLPMVFTTEHADIQTAVHALQSGAISFLLKPVQRSTIMAEIENAFAVGYDEFRRRCEIVSVRRRFLSLTKREREVFCVIVSFEFGQQSNEQRVAALRGQVLKKMQANSDAELVLMAQQLNAVASYGRGFESLKQGAAPQSSRRSPSLSWQRVPRRTDRGARGRLGFAQGVP